jgi:predicted O-methyltransferase YrrM
LKKLIAKYFEKYHLRTSFKQIKHKFKDKELVGAEIGTRYGYNAKQILKYLNIKKLYLIDPYESSQPGYRDKSFEKAKRILKKYNKKIIFVKKLSQDAVDDIPDNLDFVYIDGSHKYEDVKRDIELYHKKLSKEGVLCGHDFDSPYVARAVIEFAVKNNIDVMTSCCMPQVDWFYGFTGLAK